MKTTKVLRTDIIELLFEVDNETILQSLYQQLKLATQKRAKPNPNFQSEDDILAIAKEPIPDYLTAEEIEAAQGGFSMDKFGVALDGLDRNLYKDETLKEMLNAIN